MSVASGSFLYLVTCFHRKSHDITASLVKQAARERRLESTLLVSMNDQAKQKDDTNDDGGKFVLCLRMLLIIFCSGDAECTVCERKKKSAARRCTSEECLALYCNACLCNCKNFSLKNRHSKGCVYCTKPWCDE